MTRTKVVVGLKQIAVGDVLHRGESGLVVAGFVLKQDDFLLRHARGEQEACHECRHQRRPLEHGLLSCLIFHV